MQLLPDIKPLLSRLAKELSEIRLAGILLSPKGTSCSVYLMRNNSNLKESKMVAKKATEVHGGMGFTDLLGLHFWFKRIGLNRHILGSPEIVREEAAKIQGL